MSPLLRDWSLLLVRGATKRDGGQVKSYPYEIREEKVLTKLKGGHMRFWGAFYAVA